MDLVPETLFGAFLALDTTAAFQILISQPILACTLIGWITGDVALGIHIGFLMQLLWMSNLPVGAAIVPEGNVGSIIGVILATRLCKSLVGYEHIIIVAVILFAMALSYLGAKIISHLRNWNVHFLKKAQALAEKGSLKPITTINIQALLLHYVIMVSIILTSVILGEYFFKLIIQQMPLHWDASARLVEIAILGSGTGLTLTLYRTKKNRIISSIGVVLGVLIFLILF